MSARKTVNIKTSRLNIRNPFMTSGSRNPVFYAFKPPKGLTRLSYDEEKNQQMQIARIKSMRDQGIMSDEEAQNAITQLKLTSLGYQRAPVRVSNIEAYERAQQAQRSGERANAGIYTNEQKQLLDMAKVQEKKDLAKARQEAAEYYATSADIDEIPQEYRSAVDDWLYAYLPKRYRLLMTREGDFKIGQDVPGLVRKGAALVGALVFLGLGNLLSSSEVNPTYDDGTPSYVEYMKVLGNDMWNFAKRKKWKGDIDEITVDLKKPLANFFDEWCVNDPIARNLIVTDQYTPNEILATKRYIFNKAKLDEDDATLVRKVDLLKRRFSEYFTGMTQYMERFDLAGERLKKGLTAEQKRSLRKGKVPTGKDGKEIPWKEVLDDIEKPIVYNQPATAFRGVSSYDIHPAEMVVPNYNGNGIIGGSAPRLFMLTRPMLRGSGEGVDGGIGESEMEEPEDIVKQEEEDVENYRDAYKELQTELRGKAPSHDMIMRAFPNTASPATALTQNNDVVKLRIVPHPFLFPERYKKFRLLGRQKIPMMGVNRRLWVFK